MADSKVSDLVSATSVGGSDLRYLIQSNTSKKISAGTFFANAGNVTLSGNIKIGGTPQTLSSPGLISLTTPITHLSADASGGTLQIPQGTTGQVKIVILISTSGGSYVFNTANIGGGGTVRLDNSGDTAQLLFTNSKWYVIGGTANVTY
jgi:proline racemase